VGIDVFINEGVPNADEVVGLAVPPRETCLFWRALRGVLNEGNPASGNVVVQVPGRSGGSFPLLILTSTQAKQVVCWLALPQRVCSPEDEPKLHLIDHVTLNLCNRKSHSSAYSPHGGKLLTARKWKLHGFPENGVSLWFGFAVHRTVVEGQVLEGHQWMRSSTPDLNRRMAEYVRFFEGLRFFDANLPANHNCSGDVLCGFLYLVDGPNVTLSHDLLPLMDEFPREFVEVVDDPKIFHIQSTGLVVGSVQLGLLLGFLPYGLREQGPFFLLPGRR
jgi:hypothetical protein